MDYFKLLGANIHAIRLAKDCTQEELAEKCELHRTYVGAVERGERNVSLKNILKIAAALEVDPATLLSYKADEEEKNGIL